MKIRALSLFALAALFTGTACAHEPTHSGYDTGQHGYTLDSSHAGPHHRQHNLLQAVVLGHYAHHGRGRWKCQSGHWHHGPRRARVHHPRVTRSYHGHSHRRNSHRRDDHRRDNHRRDDHHRDGHRRGPRAH